MCFKNDVLRALALLDNDAELFSEAYEMFQRSLSERLTALQSSPDDALRAAHTLTSSFASFGLLAASQTAASIEAVVSETALLPDPELVKRLIKDIENIPRDFPRSHLSAV